MTELPLVALLDGRLVPPTMPLLRPDDTGVLRGDGIFESTLVVDGIVRDLPEHLARLAVSAQLMDLAVPGADEWRRGVKAVVSGWTGGEMTLRLNATRGPEGGSPTCWVTGAAVSQTAVRQRAEGISVLLLDRGFRGADVVKAPWLLAGAKTLSYAVNLAALRHATAAGADDVIFVGADGAVLEAPTATVVIAIGAAGAADGGRRTLLTPPVEGILDGITVRRLFDAARGAGWQTDYRPLTPEDLLAADGLWLASSVRLLAPVTAVDGAPLATDERLRAELAALLGLPGLG